MSARTPSTSRLRALRAWVLEMARFLSVGGISFVVDLGLFNLLRFGPGELMLHKPITAKVISVAAATLVSWVGNRHWTFADHQTVHRGRELTLYAVINAIGVLIGIGALAFSHYVLDIRTPLADNVSTVIGIAVGTLVRYFGYKKFVFTSRGTAAAPTAFAAPVAPSAPAAGDDRPTLAADAVA